MAELDKGLTVEYDPKKANYLTKIVLDEEGLNTITETSCVSRLKSIKNSVEIEGIRNSHIRDGAAKTIFLAKLERMMHQDEKVSEIDASNLLEAERRKQEHFFSLSFPTISSTGGNASIIHYEPTPDNFSMIDKSKIYLVDSGAQYFDGTTDVTRTIHFSNPTQEEIDSFTKVLKGHINLACAKFPSGTKGDHIDSLARKFLWEDGKDYCHGTGHGVGHFLNVHESPPGISKGPRGKIYPGMLMSNEPGYYKDGEYGTRIESLIVSKEFKDGYCEFETVTLVPLQKKMINRDLLTPQEIEWINDYHQLCYDKLLPFIEECKDEYISKWFADSCSKF